MFVYTSPEHFKIIRAVSYSIDHTQKTINISHHPPPPHTHTHTQGIIELILATDMARHTEYMERFNQVLKKGFDYNNEEHRTLVIYIHTHTHTL